MLLRGTPLVDLRAPAVVTLRESLGRNAYASLENHGNRRHAAGAPPEGQAATDMGRRLTWREICCSADYQGRWVALDNCRYDRAASAPIEGDVVDTDDDLATLCDRIREADRSRCSIVFCDEPDPASSRPELPGGLPAAGPASGDARSPARGLRALFR